MWILWVIKALWVRNHEPHFADDSKAQRGEGTFQRLHSREEWKGRYDHVIRSHFAATAHTCQETLDDWDAWPWRVCVPVAAEGVSVEKNMKGLFHLLPHWRSEVPSSGKQLPALGAVRKVVKTPAWAKTSWGFCLAYWGVVSSHCLWTILLTARVKKPGTNAMLIVHSRLCSVERSWQVPCGYWP